MDQTMITLSHGSGGKLMHELIDRIFVRKFNNPILAELNDSAKLYAPEFGVRLAFTTDSFVVKPVIFPGGDIGKLAVCGTINDLAVTGAKPAFMAVSFILEDGLSMEILEKVVNSMAETAKLAGVEIVTGDTKVVEHGACDQIFITTTGLGFCIPGVNLGYERIAVGDKIILSGAIGDHGIAVLSKREGIAFETSLISDCAPLFGLVKEMLDACPEIRWMRDPTRGGVAATLNEMAGSCNLGALIYEERVAVKDAVAGACAMLGFDPLYVANEGKLVAVVSAKDAEMLIKVMRQNELGKEAVIIGEIVESPAKKVLLRTIIGGTRILEMPHGELLPRIC